MTTEAALDLEGVCFTYPGSQVAALRKISLSCAKGEVLGVIGPNGAGKSTVLRVAAGLLRPDDGQSLVLGQDVSCLPRKEAARQVAFVPPTLLAANALRVRELVAQGRIPYLKGMFETDVDLAAVAEALDVLDIGHLKNRFYAELSSGEQRLALVARSLAQQTPLLLLDEPAANLDLTRGLDLLDRLRRMSRSGGTAIVVSLHDLNLAFRFCDRIAVLSRGGLIAVGRPEQIARPELLEPVYGCGVVVLHDPDDQTVIVSPHLHQEST